MLTKQIYLPYCQEYIPSSPETTNLPQPLTMNEPPLTKHRIINPLLISYQGNICKTRNIFRKDSDIQNRKDFDMERGVFLWGII